MRIRTILAAVGTAAVILFSQPAQAGGSWLETDRQHYSVGDHVVARGTFGRGSLEGTVRDGPFFAYLTPWDGDWEAGLTEEAFFLGPMTITEAQGRYCCWVARVEFTVPDVPPGRYWIEYCNDACTINGIGDLIGGMIYVGETEREARLASRLERAKARNERIEERIGQTAAKVEALQAEVEALRDREIPVPNEPARTPKAVSDGRPIISLAGAALAAAVLALTVAVVRRRRTPGQPPTAPPGDVPGHADELLAELERLDTDPGVKV